jgi:hypothetical protein
VHPGVGYKVPLTNESDFVVKMENILTELAQNRNHLEQLRRQGMAYAKERLTWEAKAQDMTQILEWVLRRGPRPDFLPHKVSASGVRSLSPTSPVVSVLIPAYKSRASSRSEGN